MNIGSINNMVYFSKGEVKGEKSMQLLEIQETTSFVRGLGGGDGFAH